MSNAELWWTPVTGCTNPGPDRRVVTGNLQDERAKVTLEQLLKFSLLVGDSQNSELDLLNQLQLAFLWRWSCHVVPTEARKQHTVRRSTRRFGVSATFELGSTTVRDNKNNKVQSLPDRELQHGFYGSLVVRQRGRDANSQQYLMSARWKVTS
jgi:hypothetical protein